MKINSFLPADNLKPFVKRFLIIETDESRVNRLLPDTNLVMAFRFKGQTAYIENGTEKALPSLCLSGLRNEFRQVRYSKSAGTLLVLFKESGAAVFFKEPLHELFGNTLSLDNFINQSELCLLEEKIADAKSNLQRVNIVQQFLLSRIKTYKTDPLILAAIQQIKLTKGNIRIKELSESLHISHDPFEKRFRKMVGASPKQFSSTVRFRSLINNYSNLQPFTKTAYDAGYFDQAHFIKDFKSFTGQAPKEFFKTPLLW